LQGEIDFNLSYENIPHETKPQINSIVIQKGDDKVATKSTTIDPTFGQHEVFLKNNLVLGKNDGYTIVVNYGKDNQEVRSIPFSIQINTAKMPSINIVEQPKQTKYNKATMQVIINYAEKQEKPYTLDIKLTKVTIQNKQGDILAKLKDEELKLNNVPKTIELNVKAKEYKDYYVHVEYTYKNNNLKALNPIDKKIDNFEIKNAMPSISNIEPKQMGNTYNEKISFDIIKNKLSINSKIVSIKIKGDGKIIDISKPDFGKTSILFKNLSSGKHYGYEIIISYLNDKSGNPEKPLKEIQKIPTFEIKINHHYFLKIGLPIIIVFLITAAIIGYYISKKTQFLKRLN